MSDQLLWINHAGFELRTQGLRLVCDPWLEGQVFNDGWSLISPTTYAYSDFEGVDFIWFSHEHPDHFNPQNLRKVPESARRGITALFQRTKDQRVVQFCKKLGFKVREIADWDRIALKPGVYLTCKTVGMDSFSFIETEERTYLNLNDCVPDDQARFYTGVCRRLGQKVDVLLTQFSYAGWVGNPGDLKSMRRAAAEKCHSINLQMTAFRPKFLVPFASHVWFCRKDNFHLNDGINTIADIFRAYDGPDHNCVVLYPGDVWNVGHPFRSLRSVERYMADLGSHTSPLDLGTGPVALARLQELSAAQQGKIRADNCLWALRPLVWAGLMNPVNIYVRDLELGIKYSCLGGILDQGLDRISCHIEMTSDNLAEVFKFGYASDTLMINGMFRELVPGGRFVFMRNFMVERYNDHGEHVPYLLLKPEFLKSHLGKLIKRTV